MWASVIVYCEGVHCLSFPSGHPIPQIFQTSTFTSSSSRRKSFTIPQSIRKYPCQEPLLSKDGPSSPDLQSTTDDIPDAGTDPFATSLPGSSSNSSLPNQISLRSTNSTTFSEASLESRISTQLCPEDATYPRGGFLGLTDCMSTRNKTKS